VTETLTVLPCIELVLYTVAVDAGSVVLIVVVESAELVIVTVDCAAVTTVLLETILKLVTVDAASETCWVELTVATL
jgi:DNA polymerase III psi subunit